MSDFYCLHRRRDKIITSPARDEKGHVATLRYKTRQLKQHGKKNPKKFNELK